MSCLVEDLVPPSEARPPFPETLSCEGRISQARCSGMDGGATSSRGLTCNDTAVLKRNLCFSRFKNTTADKFGQEIEDSSSVYGNFVYMAEENGESP